jgi:hypothetical protein
MKRWLVVLLVALILGALGFTLHQNYFEIIGLVLLVFALAELIWSWVRLSYDIRPRPRRRFRRISLRRRPVEEEDGVRRSHTGALHAMIFRNRASDLEE